MSKERQRRREIQLTLYHAYRRHGAPADLYQVKRNVVDLDTGENGQVVERLTIQLVSFKANQRSLFDYDIGYIKANSNFVYGGQYEASDRMGFFSTRNLPTDFKLSKEDYIVVQGERYNLFRFDAIDYQAGYIVHMRLTHGQEVYGQKITQHVEHVLDVQQDLQPGEYQQLEFVQSITVEVIPTLNIQHDLSFTQEINHD